jgi:dihydroxy-acid dehydratase
MGMRFDTIGVSDGMSMGTDGMSYSLQSRDLIADSVETVMAAQWYDALVALPGCDKNMPGVVIAMGRLDRPSIMVYGGTIKPGCATIGGVEEQLDIVSAFQSYGQNRWPAPSPRRSARPSSPTPAPAPAPAAACTRPTPWPAPSRPWASACRSPRVRPQRIRPRSTSASPPATPSRPCLEKELTPRRIVTRASFENALVLTMALGGSTNAVLHSIAMARAFGIELTIEDWLSVSNRVPLLADLKPSGAYVMEQLHEVGGIPGSSGTCSRRATWTATR